jgi:TPR repeat protein
MALVLLAAPVHAREYMDGWGLSSQSLGTKIDSWEFFISLSVLDGQGSNDAKLFRSQINQSVPATVRPKPRRRLGDRGTDSVGSREESSNSYEARVDEAMHYLQNEIALFSEQWNVPMDPGEPQQFVHEITAECVFSVNKRNGAVTVESLADAPKSGEMKRFGNGLAVEDQSIPNEVPPFSSDPTELERLGKFVISFAPIKLPDALAGFPGESLRFRLIAKVVGYDDGTNSYLPKALRTKHSIGKHAETIVEARDLADRKKLDSPPVIRPSSARSIDVEDPEFHFKIGFRYLNGDGLKRDLPMALDHFRTAAEKGYAPAQCQLAYMYQFGMGADRDIAKACFWYRKASDQGNTQAMYDIGCIYQNGDGIARDPAEAAKWERKAADLGCDYAQSSLGVRYAEGDGVDRDPVEAFKWFLKAAGQDYAFAQFSIGRMYEEGRGVAKDEIEALAWFNLSPTSGLNDKINYRDRLEQRLGPQAVLEAQRRAEDLRKRIQKRKD